MNERVFEQASLGTGHHVVAPPPPLAMAIPRGGWIRMPREELVGRALAREADDRWQRAAEMRDALDAAFLGLEGLP